MTNYIPIQQSKILKHIKGGVVLMYDEEDGEIQVLVKHHDKFEWLNVVDCLPSDSEREYQIELCEVIDIETKKPRT